ncbi:ATP-binding cassette domain-containing protein [Fusibacter sp. JL298sf-3]
MIEGIGLKKQFGDCILFNNLNFKIESGEAVCFSGVSGSGKTTLLHMIGLIEPFDSGKLLIDGKAYKSRRDKLMYFRKDVGFLFQNYALIENKTVRENLELVHKKYRTEYTVEEALRIVGLEDKIDVAVYTLSGGEQQRVALARLYLKQCSIILADEPTGSLDSENALRVVDTLLSLNKQGKTLIVVTHDEEIKRRIGKVYLL